MTSNASWINKLIDERYRIEKLLGEGSMGVAYLAEQEGLGRKVVLKALRLNLANDEEGCARFLREAQVLNTLSHKNLVQVYSCGIYEEEIPYICMEFLEGNTLEELLKTQGPLNWKSAVRLALQICDVMSYAHGASVIHRDLKPSNIYVINEPEPNTVKVIDFGLARVMTEGQKTLTATGMLIGSPAYMSPECCEGRRAGEQSDIYSLACILYECLSGRPPFQSEMPFELFNAHRNTIPEAPSKLAPTAKWPKELDATVLKALEKEPEKRFTNMDQFAENLRAVLDNQALTFDLEELSSLKQKRSKKKNLGLFASLGVLFLALVVGLTVSFKMATKRGHKDTQIQHSSQAAFRDLKTIDELLNQLEKFDTARDQVKASDTAARILKIFYRELSCSRIYAETTKKELALINKVEKFGRYFYGTETYTVIARESGAHLSPVKYTQTSAHNKGMWQFLIASINRGYPEGSWSCVEPFCTASSFFTSANEFDLAKLSLEKANEAVAKFPKQTSQVYSYLRCLHNIAATAFELENDKPNILTQKSRFESMLKAQQGLVRTFDDEHIQIYYCKLGRVCIDLGYYDLAVSAFKKTLSNAGAGVDWCSKEALWGLVKAYKQQKKYAEALEQLQILEDNCDPDNMKSFGNKSAIESERARIKRLQKQ